MVVAGMDDERRGDGEYLTEDVILELLTILVDPLLPAYDVDYVPSYPDQESVAMQVHATVVIYNYYLRRQLPELQFLDAERFCNLLGRLKPTLAPHFSKSSDHLSPTEKCMSLAEKKVAEACNISSALDASMAEPNITEWRITKVSIFLVDSLRKNCFLQFGSVFKGVWSIIEQEVDLSTGHVKVNINRRRQNHQGSKTAENCTTNDQYPDEATCRRLALGAVEAATGILESGVEVIQSGVVYSINKEKSAARVFFMQSTNPSKDGIFEVPIKDALASLSGPLMTKRARGWRHTRVVEFFHVIPYHRLLLEWTSRETPPGRELRDENSGVKASDVVSNSFGNERNPSKCLINERSVISVDSQDLNDDGL